MRNKRRFLTRLLLAVTGCFALILYLDIKLNHPRNGFITLNAINNDKGRGTKEKGITDVTRELKKEQTTQILRQNEKERKQMLLTPLIYTRSSVFKKLPSNYLPRGFTETDDRVVAQLRATSRTAKGTHKVILQYDHLGYQDGEEYFKKNCLVNTCTLTSSRSKLESADGVIFKTDYKKGYLPERRNKKQIWMVFMLESPMHSGNVKQFENKVNWTLTYRADSTIVTPYFKYVPFAQQGGNVVGAKLSTKVNYAEGKSKLIAWFVSNCHTGSGRATYVKELKKYVKVDVYGLCGIYRCDRFSETSQCEEMLEKDYKFYLGFENSKCKDYITEKPHGHALL